MRPLTTRLSTLRLRTQILLSLAIALAACFLGIGSYAGKVAIAAVSQRIEENLFLSADSAATLLAANLAEREEEIQLLARAPHLIAGDLSSSAVLGSLNARKDLRAEYAWIGVANTKGTVLYASGGLLVGADVSERHWFAEARNGHFVGDVHDAVLLAKLLPQKKTGQPIRFIDIAAPIHAGDGTWRGVLGAHIDWDWVTGLVENAVRNDLIDPATEVMIADRKGTIIYPAPDSLDDGQATKLPGQPVSGAFRWDDGVTYLTAFAPVPSGKPSDWGWTVIVRQSEAHALAAAHDLRDRLVWIGLISVVALSSVGWLLVARISRPLEALACISRSIDAGDKDVTWLDERDLSGAEVSDLHHALRGMVGTLLAREAQLTDLNQALEAKVAERTAELEQAVASKRDFIASLSHEIRTPMNSVIGLSNLLRQSDLPPAQRDYAERIHTAGTALVGVLNDILDHSRIEAGALTIEATTFDLYDFIHQVKALFAEHARAKGIDLVIEADPQLSQWVVGDPLRLLQIASNLVSNAIKFTAEGFVKVSFQCISQTHGPGTMKIMVRDTGPGIDPQQAEFLFDPFRQAHSSTARLHGGSGLGLAITKRLVDLMGGSVGVESTPGLGTCFWVKVRLGAVTDDGVTKAQRRQRMTETSANLADLRKAATPIHGARILLVDDNDSNLLVGTEYLERMGLSVTVAHSGADVIERIVAKGETFDAVLMDLHMPDMSGFEATRRLRAREFAAPGEKRLPVIALTAASIAAEDLALVEAGIDDVVSKPIRPRDLLQSLLTQIAGLRIEAQGDAGSVPQGQEMRPRRADQALTDMETRLRHSFVRDFAAAPAALRRCVGTRQDEETGRILHMVKGLAPAIGAGELHELAIEAERRIAAGEPADIRGFADALERVIADLGSAAGDPLSPTAAPAQPPHLPAAGLSAALEALGAMCRVGNIRALQACADLRAAADAAGHALDLRAVNDALQRYDFDGALEALALLCETGAAS